MLCSTTAFAMPYDYLEVTEVEKHIHDGCCEIVDEIIDNIKLSDFIELYGSENGIIVYSDEVISGIADNQVNGTNPLCRRGNKMSSQYHRATCIANIGHPFCYVDVFDMYNCTSAVCSDPILEFVVRIIGKTWICSP